MKKQVTNIFSLYRTDKYTEAAAPVARANESSRFAQFTQASKQASKQDSPSLP